VPDYTVEMFHEDYAELSLKMMPYSDIGTLNPRGNESNEEKVVQEVMDYFITKYGKLKGVDFEFRFISIHLFIEHYQKELLQEGLAVETSPDSIRLQNELLEVLLSSLKDPQPPSHIPSSPLFNQDHQFNFKKVIKAAKK
jgi:hypothetical protein